MANDGGKTALKEWVESKRFSDLPPPNGDVTEDVNMTGVPRLGEEILGGKYEIEHVIGVGGMGVVVSAMHRTLKQRVAIKFLASPMRSEELVDRFVREGQAAARIKSEHIASVLDVGVLDNGTPYLMMEHLSGADLSDYLGEHDTVPIEEAVDFVLQALDALAVAHSAGIVHRDLKPSNLFLTQRSDGSPLVKVLDFGISKIQAKGPDPSVTLTRPGMMLGSPRYMSPEQLRNASSVDHRADIWAMGIVLHELIAGSPPYDADTFTALCTMIVSDPPTSLRSVMPNAPAELEAVILKCIAKNVADRWNDVGELAAALAPFASPDSRVIATRIGKILGHVPQKTPPGSRPSINLATATPKPADRTLPLHSAPPATPSTPASSSPLATSSNDGRVSQAPNTDRNAGALAISQSSPGKTRSGRTIAIATMGIAAVLAVVSFVAFKRPVAGQAASPAAEPHAAAAPTEPFAEPLASATQAPAPTHAPAPVVTTAAPPPATVVAKTPAVPGASKPHPKTAAAASASQTPTVQPPSEEDMLNRRR